MGKIKSWMMQNNLLPNDDPYDYEYPIGYATFDDFINNNLEQYLQDLQEYYDNSTDESR